MEQKKKCQQSLHIWHIINLICNHIVVVIVFSRVFLFVCIKNLSLKQTKNRHRLFFVGKYEKLPRNIFINFKMNENGEIFSGIFPTTFFDTYRMLFNVFSFSKKYKRVVAFRLWWWWLGNEIRWKEMIMMIMMIMGVWKTIKSSSSSVILVSGKQQQQRRQKK